MWFLRSEGYEYLLVPGRKYKVGRKDCHILIHDDKSISRCHAELIVQPQVVEGPQQQQASTVTLRDFSKFGTLVNGCKLEKRSADVYLNSGDKVQFGHSPDSKLFELELLPLVVCCSGMAQSERKQISSLAGSLGGSVVQTWTRQCVALIMNKLTVTQKVVSALACCRPVATAQWLADVAEPQQEAVVKPLPDYTKYLPPLVDRNADNQSTDFHISALRKNLFSGKQFFFSSKSQLALYELCISACGGECALAQRGGGSLCEEQLCSNVNCLLVIMDERALNKLPSPDKKWILQLYEKLQKSENRAIHDTEIVRAVLHCSTEAYCNPASQAVPQGSPLPPPSLSQMSQLPQPSQFNTGQTTIGPPMISSTQMQSQISLLDSGRRDSALDVSASSSCLVADPLTQNRDILSMGPPQLPVHSQQQQKQRQKQLLSESSKRIDKNTDQQQFDSMISRQSQSTSHPSLNVLPLLSPTSSVGDKEDIFAPSSLPSLAGVSVKESSASFVMGLFPSKRKRSVDIDITSEEKAANEPPLKRPLFKGDESAGKKQVEKKSQPFLTVRPEKGNMLFADHNLKPTESSSSNKTGSGAPVDNANSTIGHRLRQEASASGHTARSTTKLAPNADTGRLIQSDIQQKPYEARGSNKRQTSNSESVDIHSNPKKAKTIASHEVQSADCRTNAVQDMDGTAGGNLLQECEPVYSQSTTSRRPKRFIKPQKTPSTFISTRKNSKAYYHPPVSTDSSMSKMLVFSRPQTSKNGDSNDSQDANQSSMKASMREDLGELPFCDATDEYDSDDVVFSMPEQQYSLLPLLSRSSPNLAVSFEDNTSGASISDKNYKNFSKIHPVRHDALQRTVITIGDLKVYDKYEGSTVQFSNFEEEEGVKEEEDEFLQDSNPFLVCAKK